MRIQIINTKYSPENGGVIAVSWEAEKADGDISHTVNGTVHFYPKPESETFVPFEDLTEQIVLGWVLNHELDGEKLEDVIEASLDRCLEKLKHPHIEEGLPWA